MAKKKEERPLPAIHETARLWFPSEAKTLNACSAYLRTLKPGWSLSWLRDAAPQILNNALSESALRSAVDQNVPERARDSVWAAVKLLLEFARRGQWSGIALPPHDVPVGLGLTVRVRPIGMFNSPVRSERCLMALQPRQDYAPTYAQDQIWLSALYYEFCTDPLEPLEPRILDLSLGDGGNHRTLTELTRTELPLLSKDELDSRLDLVARCFVRAKEAVPPPEVRRPKERPSGQIDLLDPDRED
jgi:hypothetical protein